MKNNRKRISMKPFEGAVKTTQNNYGDKSGMDTNADSTNLKLKDDAKESKFDKPASEPHPNTTGIDTNSDKAKTKKNFINISHMCE